MESWNGTHSSFKHGRAHTRMNLSCEQDTALAWLSDNIVEDDAADDNSSDFGEDIARVAQALVGTCLNLHQQPLLHPQQQCRSPLQRPQRTQGHSDYTRPPQFSATTSSTSCHPQKQKSRQRLEHQLTGAQISSPPGHSSAPMRSLPTPPSPKPQLLPQQRQQQQHRNDRQHARLRQKQPAVRPLSQHEQHPPQQQPESKLKIAAQRQQRVTQCPSCQARFPTSMTEQQIAAHVNVCLSSFAMDLDNDDDDAWC